MIVKVFLIHYKLKQSKASIVEYPQCSLVSFHTCKPLSRVRNCNASAKCSGNILGFSVRSAIIRATLNIRSCARALRCWVSKIRCNSVSPLGVSLPYSLVYFSICFCRSQTLPLRPTSFHNSFPNCPRWFISISLI